MEYQYYYKSHLGIIVLRSNGTSLTHLSFCDDLITTSSNDNIEYFKESIKWLDLYFNKQNPSFVPKYSLENISPFQKEVLLYLLNIPYGKVITYKDIKVALEKKLSKRVSCQAIGQALKNNPLPLILPCHRVIGQNNKLTGYNGGIERKKKLLELEGLDISLFN